LVAAVVPVGLFLALCLVAVVALGVVVLAALVQPVVALVVFRLRPTTLLAGKASRALLLVRH
jgi:hypothetical protein